MNSNDKPSSDNIPSLDSLRTQIDSIDIELQRLFEQRMAICDRVAMVKKLTDAPVFQSGREQQIIEKVRERSEGFADSSELFFSDIMSISRERQKAIISKESIMPQSGAVNVIIACGGSSSRMGFNKLMYKLDGEPAIVKSVRAFDSISSACRISRIIISTSDSFKAEIGQALKQAGITADICFTSGGKTRQESVYNAVSAVTDDCGWLCIHDGARPFISGRTIKQCLDDARQTGAAVVCVPVKDTIKAAAGGFVSETLERSTLFSAQTPQVISLALYRRAAESAQLNGSVFTDDVSMCEAIGVMPRITIGEYSNIKLTTPEDILLAELMLKKGGASDENS